MEFNQSLPVGAKSEEAPLWAIRFFRVIAFVVVVNIILFQLFIYFYLVPQAQDFFSIVTEGEGFIPTTTFGVLFALSALVLFLGFRFARGLYKLERWAVPVIVVFAFSTLVVALLYIGNQSLSSLSYVQLVYLVFKTLIIFAVAIVGIRYWGSFSSSARKLLVQIPLLLLLLIPNIYTSLTLLFPDNPKIHDSDLILAPTETLPEYDNAHYFLPVIKELSPYQAKIYEEALAFANNQDEKDLRGPQALKYVEDTKYLTDQFIEASYKRGYQCPTIVNVYDPGATICPLNDIRNLAILTTLRADVEAAAGNPNLALIMALSVVHVGSMIANTEQPLFIEYLLGVAVMNIGLDSIERTLQLSPTIDELTRSKMLEDLQAHIVKNSSFENSLKREYMTLKTNLQAFEGYSTYFYQHNNTINDLAEFFRKQIAVTAPGCDAETSREQQELELYVDKMRVEAWRLPPFITPNFIGKVLNSITLASLNSAGQKMCAVNDRIQSVQDQLKQMSSSPSEDQRLW